MKDLRELISILADLVSLIPLFGLVVAGLSTLFAWGTATDQVSLPRWASIVLVAFVAYPVLKFMLWLARPQPKPFEYSGLLWQPHRFGWEAPLPLCPHDGCLCRLSENDQVSIIGHSPDGGPFVTPRAVHETTYVCPKHGQVVGPLDISSDELRRMAQEFFRRRRAT